MHRRIGERQPGRIQLGGRIVVNVAVANGGLTEAYSGGHRM